MFYFAATWCLNGLFSNATVLQEQLMDQVCKNNIISKLNPVGGEETGKSMADKSGLP